MGFSAPKLIKYDKKVEIFLKPGTLVSGTQIPH